MEITSVANAKVKTWMKYHQKKHRDADGMFLVEGEHLIEEAIRAKILCTLLVRKGMQHPFAFEKEVYEVSDEIMDKLSSTVSHENYIGVCHKLSHVPASIQRVLLLDDVQDPGNMGTIIRTAYSFGFDVIYTSKGCVDLYNEKVIRSTQGALFHLPVMSVDLLACIKQLKEKNIPVYATSLRNAKALSEIEISDTVALVLGNEGSGVSEAVIDACDHSVIIEMNAFESLNVAVAAGICMYHFRKR